MNSKDQPHASNTGGPAAEPVASRLAEFEVVSSPPLRSTILWLPAALGILLLADWLVGSQVFAGDGFRLTGVLVVAIEFVILGVLLADLENVLNSLWARRVVSARDAAGAALPEYLAYLDRFEAALNARWALLVGGVCAIGALSATYPVRYFLQTGTSPFTSAELFAYYLWGNAAIVAAPLGYVLGILIWCVGVIAVYIGRLGREFRIEIQPNHPDKCGGLKPLGDLCLKIALLVLAPAIYLSGWGFASAFLSASAEIYTVLWSTLFRQWLVFLVVLAPVTFLLPLYSVHRQMGIP